MPVEQKQAGFIALMTAIIIALVLMTLTLSLSLSGFFTRFNIADSEYKERSSALAEACADAALLKIAQNSSYAPTGGGEVVSVNSDSCRIVAVTKAGTQSIIKTQGIFPNSPPEQAYTNLTIVISNSDLSIISWDETSN